MATTTPNYGWTVPTSSDLIKNGATAIETLGDSVDTSLWSSGYGQAGKNKIINGDFGIWQRGTSFTNPTNNVYTSDRWVHGFNDANPTSSTTSRQAFTAGTAPVAGYEGTFFARSTITTVGATTIFRPFTQRIEDVRTFANQTITISFWAKADSARSLTVNFQQNFGSGGSSTIGGAGLAVSLTSSWQRFTWSIVAIPSISGKTIGTNSYLEILFQQAAASGSVLDIWGVQVEYGSKATPFQTASGSPQAELAMCQRYYEKSYAQGSAPAGITTANAVAWNAASTTSDRNYVYVPFKVTKRGAPTITVYSPVTGTSAKLYNAITSAGDKNASTNYIQDNSFSIYLGPTDGANAVGDLLLAHYVASAEL